MAKQEKPKINKFTVGLIIGVVAGLILFAIVFSVSSEPNKLSFSWFKPNAVGVIDIRGEIGASGSILSPGLDIDQIISDLEEIDQDSFYGGVLIKIDSP